MQVLAWEVSAIPHCKCKLQYLLADEVDFEIYSVIFEQMFKENILYFLMEFLGTHFNWMLNVEAYSFDSSYVMIDNLGCCEILKIVHFYIRHWIESTDRNRAKVWQCIYHTSAIKGRS